MPRGKPTSYLDEFDDDGKLTARYCACEDKVLPVERFYRNRTSRAGYGIQCKQCVKYYKYVYYERHKDKILDRQRIWWENNREWYLAAREERRRNGTA